MKIYPINAGYFKLDGGAMFGVVPKSIWSRTNEPDSKNMCSWAMRCMLVEDGDRLMLIDTGIGDKQSEKFFSYYFLHGDATLQKSLAAHGFGFDDITDVFLTHLHFDHCGGAITQVGENRFEPVFKNAKYWSNKDHWQWATVPNMREKASFLKENINPIEASGQLQFVERKGQITTNVFDGMDVFFANGHTEAQMLPMLHYKGKKLVFMADMLPSTGHIPLAYVMGYDTRPLLTLEEKSTFLNMAADEEMVLFLEHDAINQCCTVQHTERGVRLKDAGSFKDFFG